MSVLQIVKTRKFQNSITDNKKQTYTNVFLILDVLECDGNVSPSRENIISYLKYELVPVHTKITWSSWLIRSISHLSCSRQPWLIDVWVWLIMNLLSLTSQTDIYYDKLTNSSDVRIFKFRIESNSYFSIRFDSKRVQMFEIFEYLPSPNFNFLTYLNRMTPIFQLRNHA